MTVVADSNTANDVTVVEKLDVTTGTVEATRGTNEYRINGTWYEDAATSNYIGGSSAVLSMSVGDEVNVTASNGFIFAAEKVNGTSVDNILYVVAVDSDKKPNATISSELGTYKGVDTRVLLPDGSDKVVKSMRVDVTTQSDGISKADTDLRKAVPVAGLYTYTVNSNDVYELKAVKETGHPVVGGGKYAFDAANLPANADLDTVTGMDESSTYAYVKGSGNTSSKLDGKLIADDAIIYIIGRDGGETKTKTVDGATLKTMASVGTDSTYITKKVNGMDTVIMAFITSGKAIGGSSVDTAYGYVTSKGYYTENGDDGVIKFTVWNGSEEVELTDVSSSLTSADANNTKYAKGAFVTYTTSATVGEVTGVAEITTEDAITGYDGGYNIDFETSGSKVFKDDNKTVVIYVDTANVKGVEGGSIALAQEVSTGHYVKNAVVKITGSEVDVLFVDIANKLDKAGYTVGTVTAATDTTQGITLTSAVSTAAGALSSSSTVAAGSTITVTVTPSGNENGTGAYARTATVVMTRADGVTESKSVSFACDTSTAISTAAKSVTFTMPDMGVTSIVVSYT